MKTDGSPVRTVLSDSAGGFKIAIDTGKYFLLYTCAGYYPFQSGEINISGLQELAAAYLRRDSGQLAAVTVYGRRPVIEPLADGFVYNAENDVAIAAGSAVDVLRKIPMVMMTPDGAPSIRGSTNVRVFIDNKPSTVMASSVAEALQQVPSEEIAKVEIITHPSSRYDAEGTDAVINIITKKRRYDGYNGNLRTIIGNWNQELTGTLKWRTGYWILNFDGGLYHSRYEQGTELFRSANKFETANRVQQVGEFIGKRNIELASLNVTRILDSLNTLNFTARIRAMEGRDDAVQHSYVYSADTISDQFVRRIPTTYGNTVVTYTGGYNGQSRDKKKDYNFLAVYFRHKGDDAYNLQQLREEVVDYREKSDATTENREFAIQGDFVQNFTRLSKFETGLKGTWRTTLTENNFDIYNRFQDKFQRDEHRSNTFTLRRGVYAAYASYSQTIKKLQSRVGLRFEQTDTYTRFKDTEVSIPDFSNLLPNILFKYSFNDQHSLAYTYTSRISRPYVFYLNPNINYIDSLNIMFGNPELEPEATHQHVLDYNFNKRSLFAGLALMYARTRRAIDEIRRLRPDGVTETTWLNIGHYTQWSLSGTMRYNKSKLSVGTTLTLQHVTRTSPALNLTGSGFLGQISVNGSYRFNKGYTLESYIYYESRSINLQQTRTDYLFYNLLLTKKLLNDKLLITARADGFLAPWWNRTTVINTSTLYSATTYRSINRYLRLAISWKFGKQDLRTPVTRNVESGD